MNRHLKIAFIVAPFLAIGGYALVDQYDYYQARKQIKALFPLKVDGNCVLLGEGCSLTNPALKLRLSVSGSPGNGLIPMQLESSAPLSGGKLGFGELGSKLPQKSLMPGRDGQHWKVALPQVVVGTDSEINLKMVVTSGGRVYIADVNARVR